jgi:hypothetical protein
MQKRPTGGPARQEAVGLRGAKRKNSWARPDFDGFSANSELLAEKRRNMDRPGIFAADDPKSDSLLDRGGRGELAFVAGFYWIGALAATLDQA